MCVWSNKLIIEERWVWNGFRPFKTQRNARKLFEEAKFESNYLFQVRGIHFELENMEFLHGQWVSSKFPMNFKLIMLIFELRFFLPLMSSKLISNLPKFQTQPPVIEFEPQDMSKRVPKASIQFKTLCTQLELVIFEALLGCLWLFIVISGQWEGATC